MRFGTLAFAGGIISIYCIGKVPTWQVLASALMLVVTAINFKPLRRPGRWALLFVLGLCWCTWHLDQAMHRQLSPDLAGRWLSVRGYVCGLPKPASYGRVRFDLCTTDWRGQDHGVRLRLVTSGQQPVTAGYLLHAQVKLKPPHSPINPAGFRYQTWLFQHGYMATGKARQVNLIPGDGCQWQCRLQAWRQQLIDRFESVFGGLHSQALAASLLFGDRNGLDRPHWQILQRTGTIHLVAISGLHLGLLATLLGWLTRQLLLRVAGQRMSPIRQRMLVLMVVLAGCSFYALLAGFSVATQRALVMVTVGALAWARGFALHPWAAWRWALAAVLLINPLAPLGAGFWLSFSAVAALIAAFTRRLRQPRPWLALMIAQLAVGAALIPVLSALGLPTSNVGWVANLLAIPWVSLVILPVLVALVPLGMMFPSLASTLAPLIDGVVHPLWWWLAMLAGHGQLWYWGKPLFAAMLAIAASLLLWPVSWRLKAAVVVVLVLIGLQLHVRHPNQVTDGLRLRVFDVGEGLAVLVRQGHHALLYDTGPARDGSFSTVSEVLLPSFATLGVRHLDAMVVDHAHRDQDDDLPALKQAIPVGRWVAGDLAQAQEALNTGIGLKGCRHASPIRWRQTRITFWQASPERVHDQDDRSCVVTIKSPQGSFLLPGDLKAPGEHAYLAAHPGQKSVTVLVAPHPGGADTSLVSWTHRLRPRWVVFSTGFHNRFHHPEADVVARYRREGSRVVTTARHGSLLFSVIDGTVTLRGLGDNVPVWLRR